MCKVSLCEIYFCKGVINASAFKKKKRVCVQSLLCVKASMYDVKVSVCKTPVCQSLCMQEHLCAKELWIYAI